MTVTARFDAEKVRSLKIDAEHKLPSRGGIGIVFFSLGVMLGLGSGLVYLVFFGGGAAQLRTNRTQLPIGNGSAAAAPAPAPIPVASAAEASLPLPPPVSKATESGGLILTSSGYVTPRHRISLSPRVTGRVVWVGIEKGDRVEKGQVLVRLEDEEYQAQRRQTEARLRLAEARLAELENGSRPEDIARATAAVREAEAALANANATLDRRDDLTVSNVESQQRLDDAVMQRDMAHARLESAKSELARWQVGARREEIDAARAEVAASRAALEYAELQVGYCEIHAPIAGTILEKLIEVGELVTPQSFGGTRGARTELLSLADLGDLQVELDINESDFAKVTMGQPARVYLDAYPSRAYEGIIREIAPEANRTKATVQIKVRILNPDTLVLPEMSARVDLLAPMKDSPEVVAAK